MFLFLKFHFCQTLLLVLDRIKYQEVEELFISSVSREFPSQPDRKPGTRKQSERSGDIGHWTVSYYDFSSASFRQTGGRTYTLRFGFTWFTASWRSIYTVSSEEDSSRLKP